MSTIFSTLRFSVSGTTYTIVPSSDGAIIDLGSGIVFAAELKAGGNGNNGAFVLENADGFTSAITGNFLTSNQAIELPDATINLGGTLVTDTTQTGNVGAGEDTLQSYTVPVFMTSNGFGFSFVASGTIANNANAKRLRVKFGGTTILDTGASGIPVSTAIDWGIAGIVIRTSNTTQKAFVTLTTNTTTLTSFCDYTTPAETLSSTVTFLITGEAVSNNDIVKELFKGYAE